MKYFLTRRSKKVHLKDDVDFVKWMRKTDYQVWQNNSDFMEEYAYRKFIFEKITLRFYNENVFVKDLQKHGLLEIEEPKKDAIKFPIIKIKFGIFPNLFRKESYKRLPQYHLKKVY